MSDAESDGEIYHNAVNGIAESVHYPEAGETVTLRSNAESDRETVTVERVDRRRTLPIILKEHVYGSVARRTIVEYSKRVENE